MPVTQLHDDESIGDRDSLPGCRMYRCDVRNLGPLAQSPSFSFSSRRICPDLSICDSLLED